MDMPNVERMRGVDWGSLTDAESALKASEKRATHLNTVALSPSDTARFSQAWRRLQVRFIENPAGVVAEADRLAREVMDTRGYPMEDFESRAADIAIDHPAVVDHYRAVRATAMRDEVGDADTTAQRRAVVHFRALFDELLESKILNPEVIAVRQMESPMWARDLKSAA